MRPNLYFSGEAIFYRIDADPIMKSKNKSPTDGELAVLFQHGKPT